MSSLQIRARTQVGRQDSILNPEALAFVGSLVRRFGPGRMELLAKRRERQARYDQGELPSFLAETRAIRDGDWKVAAPPSTLQKRVVEITGPVDRKMIINALNSDADVFMADFEDSSAPAWDVVIGGQINLLDAVEGSIEFVDEARGKHYQLQDDPAILFVRPRGLHLIEAHLELDAEPVPASLVDFGLFVFHNARTLAARDAGPYFYIPKLESHLEARWWNEIFSHCEDVLGLARGQMRATVLIETLPAAFEMDEILYELREHSVGLNCGRWDYIFSFIKTLRSHAEFVIPDRGAVGMSQPNMRAYADLLIRTCHRRGTFAMGGMAAQIPIRNDATANDRALASVASDKAREAKAGHDGTWVAHPGLIGIARQAFESVLEGRPNQITRPSQDTDDELLGAALLTPPIGPRTDASLRQNVRVGIRYLEAWLRGNGCVPLYHLMEDAATAEISRMQIWQWIKHGAITDDGRPVTAERINDTVEEELAVIATEVGSDRFESGKFNDARELFSRVATNTASLTEFLTLPAYEALVATTAPTKQPGRNT